MLFRSAHLSGREDDAGEHGWHAQEPPVYGVHGGGRAVRGTEEGPVLRRGGPAGTSSISRRYRRWPRFPRRCVRSRPRERWRRRAGCHGQWGPLLRLRPVLSSVEPLGDREDWMVTTGFLDQTDFALIVLLSVACVEPTLRWYILHIRLGRGWCDKLLARFRIRLGYGFLKKHGRRRVLYEERFNFV